MREKAATAVQASEDGDCMGHGDREVARCSPHNPPIPKGTAPLTFRAITCVSLQLYCPQTLHVILPILKHNMISLQSFHFCFPFQPFLSLSLSGGSWPSDRQRPPRLACADCSSARCPWHFLRNGSWIQSLDPGYLRGTRMEEECGAWVGSPQIQPPRPFRAAHMA